ELGKDLGKIPQVRLSPPRPRTPRAGTEMAAKDLHPRPIGRGIAALPAMAPENLDAALVGDHRNLLDERGLTHSCVSGHQSKGASSRRQGIETRGELSQLSRSPDKDVSSFEPRFRRERRHDADMASIEEARYVKSVEIPRRGFTVASPVYGASERAVKLFRDRPGPRASRQRRGQPRDPVADLSLAEGPVSEQDPAAAWRAQIERSDRVDDHSRLLCLARQRSDRRPVAVTQPHQHVETRGGAADLGALAEVVTDGGEQRRAAAGV